MAAVEDHEERAVGGKRFDELLMQHIAVNLPVILEVDGTDGVENARGVVSCGVLNLSSMAGIMKEVDGAGLTYEPIDSSLQWLAKLCGLPGGGLTRILCPVGL